MSTESRLVYRIAIVLALIIFICSAAPVFADENGAGIVQEITNGTVLNETVAESPTETIPVETTIQPTDEITPEPTILAPVTTLTDVTPDLAPDNEPTVNTENNLEILDFTKTGIQGKRSDNSIRPGKALSGVKVGQDKTMLLNSIKKYDLVTFDHKSLNKKIESGEALSLRINGKDYQTDLKRMNFKEIDDGIYSYKGKLAGVRDSEVLLTTSKNAISGHVTIEDETYWIEPIETRESAGKESPVHVIYNANDVDPSSVHPDSDLIGESGNKQMGSIKGKSLSATLPDYVLDMITTTPEEYVTVRVLVVTDDEFKKNLTDWEQTASGLFAEVNNQFGRDDIRVIFVPVFDDSKSTELSNNPFHLDDPLMDFEQTYSITDLDNADADLGIYLSGYESTQSGVGATHGFLGPESWPSRLSWAQMHSEAFYPADTFWRSNTIIHELGHNFDAGSDGVTPSGVSELSQYASYARSTSFGVGSSTVMDYIPLTIPTNEFSSFSSPYCGTTVTCHGSIDRDNARRIRETRDYIDSLGQYYYITPITYSDKGTIEPATPQRVSPWGSQTFYFNPKPGYVVSNLDIVDQLGGVVQVGSVPEYTIDNVNSSKQITVYFAPAPTHTPTPTPTTSPPGPTAAFTVNHPEELSGPAPHYVQFIDDSTSPFALTYEWDFNHDGIIDSTNENPDYQYVSPGTYTVWMRVTDENSQSDVEIKENYITVTPPVTTTTPTTAPPSNTVADFYATPTSGEGPLGVQFHDESTSSTSYITDWDWDFNSDGNIDSHMTNPGHTYGAGTYDVTLTVYANDGSSDTEIKHGYITITSPTTIPTSIPTTIPTQVPPVVGPPLPYITQYNLTNGGYTVVIFNGTGSKTWTPPAEVKTVDYLVVGGGGEGGVGGSVDMGGVTKWLAGGGGGAGGVVTGSNRPVVGPQTIVVGNGGTGSATSAPCGAKGSGSSFGNATSTVTALGGGGGVGSSCTDHVVTSGSSGGGGSGALNQYGNGTAPQGFDGGAGYYESALNGGSGGGGGGAGAYGVTATNTNGGNGGAGIMSDITGTPLYYGGGGGGGIGYMATVGFGGAGCGGDGSAGPANSAKCQATGGGGGGAGGGVASHGFGGAGVVILRYQTPVTPVASFTGTPTGGVVPLTVTFTDASTNTPTSWRWDFNNDGIIDSTEQHPVHIFPIAGTYTVSLTAANSAGSNTMTRTNYISVTPTEVTPVADFTGTPLSGVPPLNVQFTDTSANNPTSWSWTFGDGGTSTVQNPSHTYTANGVFPVSLTATNGAGSDTETKAGYITVNPVTQTTEIVGAYTVVKFTGAGTTTWTPPYSVSQVDYLVVGGGGEGGAGGTAVVGGVTQWLAGGGGAAGGLLNGSALPVTGPQTVIVGAAGSGSTSSCGAKGGNSVFGTVTALGGGGGVGSGCADHVVTSGGSGGGGSGALNQYGNGTAPQGYDGGVPYYALSLNGGSGGGGGGASATGGAATSSTGGSGGNGKLIYITGTPTYYAGGGAGGMGYPGTDGTGGAGCGADGSKGLANPAKCLSTGAGGGGAGGGVVSHGAGGSGVVIIRYLTPVIPVVGAQVVSSTIPTTMVAGQSYPVSITMKNVGTMTWNETSLIRLGGVGDGSGVAAKFGPARIAIPAGTNVAQNQQYTFNFTMTGPQTAATYQPQYRMVWDGHQWFGDTSTSTVTVTPVRPVAGFSGTPTSGPVPLAVQFTDTSTYGPTSWSWNFGDGNTVNSTVQNPVHAYLTSGTYTVSLNATNAAGSNTTTKTGYITVAAVTPVAGFSGTPTSGSVPLTVVFTDTSTNVPTSWSWTFGDGGTSTVKNPSHTYTASGVYPVSLTATNAAGSNTTTKTGYITATPVVLIPVADFSGTPRSGVASLTVQFTDLSTNNPASWSWTFGDGGTSTVKNPSHIYTASGVYPVSLTATNAAGSNTTTKTGYITVTSPVPKPVAYFTGTPQSGTAPLTVQFTDSSTNTPTSWSWTFGDGGTSTVKNPSHIYTANGVYPVSLTATNAGGSDTKTKTNYITVSSFSQTTTIVGTNTVVKFIGPGSTTWAPPSGVTQVDYLVVGGGGEGGAGGSAVVGGVTQWLAGGGAGAGGVMAGSALPVSGTQTVVVGAGGSGSTNQCGAKGGNSSFGTPSTMKTAIGGGGGVGSGCATPNPVVNGGSGGGGSGAGNNPGTTLDSTQGRNGGLFYYSAALKGGSGGGGGGAAAVGGAATSSTGGSGGNGITSSITGTATYYGGGGAGGMGYYGTDGTGGLGCGGDGSKGPANPAKCQSTGGGGGGAGGGVASHGAGGSGVVIIRYVTPT
jgi:PKD repeat protein